MKRQVCEEIFDEVAESDEPKEVITRIPDGSFQSRSVFLSWIKEPYLDKAALGDDPNSGDFEAGESGEMKSLSCEGLCSNMIEEDDGTPQFSYYRPHSSTGIANLDEYNDLENDSPLPPPMELLCSPLRRLTIPSTSLKDCHNPPEDVTSVQDMKTSPLISPYSYNNALKEVSGGCRDSGMSCAFSSSTSLTSSETIFIPPPLVREIDLENSIIASTSHSQQVLPTRSAPPIPPHRRGAHIHRSAERAPTGNKSVRDVYRTPCHPVGKHIVTHVNTSTDQIKSSISCAPCQPPPIGASPLDSGVDDVSPGECCAVNQLANLKLGPSFPSHQQLAYYDQSGECGIPYVACHCQSSTKLQGQSLSIDTRTTSQGIICHSPPKQKHTAHLAHPHTHPTPHHHHQRVVNISHNYPYGLVVSSSTSVFPPHSTSVAHSEPTLFPCSVSQSKSASPSCCCETCFQSSTKLSPLPNLIINTNSHQHHPPKPPHHHDHHHHVPQHLSNQSDDFQSPIWKRKTPERSTVPNPPAISIMNSSDAQRHSHSQQLHDSCGNVSVKPSSSNRHTHQSDGAIPPFPQTNAVAVTDGDNRRDKIYRKRMYRLGLNLFNLKPLEGMQWLLRHKYLLETPKEVAMFLHTRKGINRQRLGEYLGDKRNELVLEAFCYLLDFRGLIVDEALRKLNYQFLLTGESDCILRITEHFSKAYWHQNETWLSEQIGIDNMDAVLLLAYSILMLNTDLNSGKLKPGSRMKLKEFSKNLRGLNNGHDFDPKLLNTIYHRIQEHPFTVREDHTNQVQHISEALSPQGSLSSPPHRRLVCICKMQECVLVDRVTSSTPVRSDQLSPLQSSFLQVQQQQRYVFLFNDFIIVACRLSTPYNSSESKCKPPSNMNQRDYHGGPSHSANNSATLLSCMGATSSMHKSKSLHSASSNSNNSGGIGSSDIISRIKHYRVIHHMRLAEAKAHLLYRNKQLFAVQLCHAVTNANLFILRAMSESDFVHFLDDLRECIWESSEMEVLLRLTDNNQAHS